MFIDTRFTKTIDQSSVDQSSLAPAEIRRHLNGSIDLDHYVRIGRAAHGAAVRGGGRLVGGIFRRFFNALSSRRSAAAE